MRNSPSSLAAIGNVFDKAAEHICSPGPNCCRGCTLARQIPGLLADIAELRADVERLTTLADQAYRDGYDTGRMHAGAPRNRLAVALDRVTEAGRERTT